MAKKPIHAIDLDLATTSRQIQRDYRTLGQKIAAGCRKPDALGIASFLLAGTAWFVPSVVDLCVLSGLAIGVLAWRIPVVLPLKLPAGYRALDPHELEPGTGAPREARGILFVGNARQTGEELYLSATDVCTHHLVMGGTGSGKTELLRGALANALLWGSGFTYVDGKGDASLWSGIFAMARACGREDDLYVLNYMTGSADIDPDAPAETRLSNTFNPFLHGSADALTQTLVAQMADAGGDSAPWKDKAIGLITAYVRILVAMRDRGYDEQGRPFTLDVGALRSYITLDNLVDLYLRARERVDGFSVPRTALEALGAYLEAGVPGYQDPAKLAAQLQIPWTPDTVRNRAYPTQPDPQTYLQHGYLQNQFNRMFGQLADVYGHIFRVGQSEIDLTDIVLQRRILVVMLPAMEKSPDELGSLGRLLIAALKTMMAVGLGARLEGTHRSVIERRPTNARAPYLCAFDEYGYYSAKGFAVVVAQARSLGFGVFFGGQDIQSFAKQAGKEEADAIVGNTLNKIAMRIEDPKETMELFEKVAGGTVSAQTTTMARDESALASGTFRDAPHVGLDRRARIDMLDIRGQTEGEAHFFRGTAIVRFDAFFAGPFKAPRYALNRFLALGAPGAADIEQQAPVTPDAIRDAVSRVTEQPLDPPMLERAPELLRLVRAQPDATRAADGRVQEFAARFIAGYLGHYADLDALTADRFRQAARHYRDERPPTVLDGEDESVEWPPEIERDHAFLTGADDGRPPVADGFDRSAHQLDSDFIGKEPFVDPRPGASAAIRHKPSPDAIERAVDEALEGVAPSRQTSEASAFRADAAAVHAEGGGRA